jgi:hypothetical protein
VAALLSLLAVASVLAACGDDDDDSATSPTTTSGAATGLQLIFVNGDQAVIANLAVPEDRYDEVSQQVEPYMLTLHPPS